MHPASSSALQSSGTAVISLLLALNLIYPNTRLFSRAHALTSTGAGAASGQRAAQCLAVQRHNLLRDGGAQALGPAHETLQERLGIQSLENAVERVVAGDSAGQFQKSFEPLVFGFPKIFHVIKALAAT